MSQGVWWSQVTGGGPGGPRVLGGALDLGPPGLSLGAGHVPGSGCWSSGTWSEIRT
jgi:hypothetical protein